MSPPINPDRVRAPAFGLTEAMPHGLHGAWHRHARVQLLYAAHGLLHLETANATWVLPPQRAALIGGGVEHRVRTVGRVTLATVYFRREHAPVVTSEVTLFQVVPLAREMILGAMQWDAQWNGKDPVGAAYFTALAGLTTGWARHALAWSLPAFEDPRLQALLRRITGDVEHAPTLAQAARLAGMSRRTLARALAREGNTTLRTLILQSRMLKAMEVLARPSANVTQAAYAVGFSSLGAFTRAFCAFAGENPSAFRARSLPG